MSVAAKDQAVTDFTDLAEALLPHVLAAGNRVMHYFHEGHEVETKADSSPVTVADRDAEEILLAALSTIRPDLPVVAEEMMEGKTARPLGPEFFSSIPLTAPGSSSRQARNLPSISA